MTRVLTFQLVVAPEETLHPLLLLPQAVIRHLKSKIPRHLRPSRIPLRPILQLKIPHLPELGPLAETVQLFHPVMDAGKLSPRLRLLMLPTLFAMTPNMLLSSQGNKFAGAPPEVVVPLLLQLPHQALQ
jgi:hypothetical protein